MGTPVQEAISEQTSLARLQELASGPDAAVRTLARSNPTLPADLRAVVTLAELNPAVLTHEHLTRLADLGPWAVRIVCGHERTLDGTLLTLVRRGHLQEILRLQSTRKAVWLLGYAKSDPELAHFLSRDPSVPFLLRRKAAALLRRMQDSLPAGLSPTAQGNAALIDTAPVSEAPPEITVESVKAKLRARHETLNLGLEEWQVIQAHLPLQRLAARRERLPVPQLLWLDEQQPYGQARETLLRRLEHHDLSSGIFELMVRHADWELRSAVARNPALPAPLLAALAQDDDWWVRAAAAENPALLPPELERLAAETDHAVIREHVAAHPATPGRVLLQLAGDAEADVRFQVSRNPSASPEALNLLAQEPRAAVREAVSAHPLTALDTLNALVDDENPRVMSVARVRQQPMTSMQVETALAGRRRQVKLALLSRNELTPAVLSSLARDRSPLIRAQVLLHPGLSAEARKVLTEDGTPDVRRLARAVDPGTSPEQLAQLPRFDARIRQGLSRNPATPALVLSSLSDDALEDVRLAVVLNPAAPDDALRRRLPEQPLRPVIRQHRLYPQVQAELHALEEHEARLPDTPSEALQLLAQSDSPKVRRRVARHPNVLLETLRVLAHDRDAGVRETLARLPVLDGELQMVLSQDADEVIRLALARRSDLNSECITALLRRDNEEEGVLMALLRRSDLQPAHLSEFAQNRHVSVRVTAAKHPLVPPDSQFRLAQDAVDMVVNALLDNPVLNPGVLEELARQKRSSLRVASHPAVTPLALERLAYSPSYAQHLQFRRVVNRMPVWVRTSKLMTIWLQRGRQRASEQAYPDLALLRAVLDNDRSPANAVSHARRLHHPEIAGAWEARKRRTPTAARNNEGESQRE